MDNVSEAQSIEGHEDLKDAVVAYNEVEKWSKTESAPFRLDSGLMSPRVRKEPKGVVLIIGYVPT